VVVLRVIVRVVNLVMIVRLVRVFEVMLGCVVMVVMVSIVYDSGRMLDIGCSRLFSCLCGMSRLYSRNCGSIIVGMNCMVWNLVVVKVLMNRLVV